MATLIFTNNLEHIKNKISPHAAEEKNIVEIVSCYLSVSTDANH